MGPDQPADRPSRPEPGGTSNSSDWTCPACGARLLPRDSGATPAARWGCPSCGRRYRVRDGASESGVRRITRSSDELPAITPHAATALNGTPVGGFGLAIRGFGLSVLRPAYHAGAGIGATVLFCCGGFVPVVGRWLKDEKLTWGGVIETLGGVEVGATGSDPDSDLGPVLGKSDAPELFTEIGDVSRRLSVKPPEQVRLTYLPCCGVVAAGRARSLLLGLPLLDVLTRIELRAILAHELAHLARGDATSAARSARFVHLLGQALDSKSGRSLSPLRAWANVCRRLADSWHAPIALGQEARADRAAATIAGGNPAADALVKVALVQPIFKEVLECYDPSNSEQLNLYALFRRFLNRIPDELWQSMRHRSLANRDVPIDAAHPALVDRLAALQAYPSRPLAAADSEPATRMLGDLEALEQMLHNRLFALNGVEPSVFHRAGSAR